MVFDKIIDFSLFLVYVLMFQSEVILAGVPGAFRRTVDEKTRPGGSNDAEVPVSDCPDRDPRLPGSMDQRKGRRIAVKHIAELLLLADHIR